MRSPTAGLLRTLRRYPRCTAIVLSLALFVATRAYLNARVQASLNENDASLGETYGCSFRGTCRASWVVDRVNDE